MSNTTGCPHVSIVASQMISTLFFLELCYPSFSCMRLTCEEEEGFIPEWFHGSSHT